MEREGSGNLDLPLRMIQSYDPSFKVDTRLHEPLWKDFFSYDDLLLEILALCSALEPLCKKEYSLSGGGIEQEFKMEYINRFEPQADVIVSKMKELLRMLPKLGLTLKQFFRKSGLTVLFPRCASYLMNSNRPMFKNQKSPLDGYFQLFSTYNQLLQLCHQLNSDVNNLSNHKYIAHQTAMLYQAVNQLGQPVAHYKKDIETHFKLIKEDLSQYGKGEVAKLSLEQKEWMNTITADLLCDIVRLLKNFDPPIRHCVQFLAQDVQAN